MAKDDTAPGLTREEIAEHHRLAAELMRSGSLAELPPDFVAQRRQELIAHLLRDQRPMETTADLNAPAVPMPSGPSSASYAPEPDARRRATSSRQILG